MKKAHSRFLVCLWSVESQAVLACPSSLTTPSLPPFLPSNLTSFANCYCILPWIIVYSRLNLSVPSIVCMRWFLTSLLLIFCTLWVCQTALKIWCWELDLCSRYTLLNLKDERTKDSHDWLLYFLNLKTAFLINVAQNCIILVSICVLLIIHM